MIETNSEPASKISVGVIADSYNRPIYAYFKALFSRAASGDPEALRYNDDAETPIRSIGNDSADRFRRYGVVIAAIGNPEMQADYQTRLHRLLDVWRDTGAKTIILLAVGNQHKNLSAQLVDKWEGWEPLAKYQLRQEFPDQDIISSNQLQERITMLKKAVKTNSNYLDWPSTVADLGECVNLARKQVAATVPSITVAQPQIQHHRATRDISFGLVT